MQGRFNQILSDGDLTIKFPLYPEQSMRSLPTSADLLI